MTKDIVDKQVKSFKNEIVGMIEKGKITENKKERDITIKDILKEIKGE